MGQEAALAIKDVLSPWRALSKEDHDVGLLLVAHHGCRHRGTPLSEAQWRGTLPHSNALRMASNVAYSPTLGV